MFLSKRTSLLIFLAMGLLRYIFCGIRLTFTKCINLIPSTFSSKKPVLTSSIFLTGRRGHTTKLVLWDYHLTESAYCSLKKLSRKNSINHTTDISNNSHPNHDTNQKLLWSCIKSTSNRKTLAHQLWKITMKFMWIKGKYFKQLSLNCVY